MGTAGTHFFQGPQMWQCWNSFTGFKTGTAGTHLLHGVNKAARGGHEGHGAVSHGLQLDQAARLEAAGHHQEV